MTDVLPAPPELLMVSGSTCRVSWRVPASVPAVQMIAIRIMDGEGRKQFCDFRTGALVNSESDASPYPAQPTFAVVKGFSCGTWYQGRIIAQTSTGWSRMSNWSLLKGMLAPQLPDAPVLEVVSSSTLRISWKVPPSNFPVLHVNITVKDDAGNTYFCDASSGSLVPDGIDVEPYPAGPDCRDCARVDGFRRGVEYNASITAQSEAGWSDCSAWSPPAKITPPETPDAPILSVLDATTMHTIPRSTLRVTGIAIDVAEESGHESFCNSETGELTSDEHLAASYPAQPMFAIVKGFTCGVKYKAQISAQSEVGWSNYSAASALVGLEPPQQPAIPKLAIADESSMLVSWSLPESILAVQAVSICFQDRSGICNLCDGGRLVPLSDALAFLPMPARPTFTLVCGLDYGMSYKVQVAAKSEAGWSRYSDLCASISASFEVPAATGKRPAENAVANEPISCAVCLNKRPQIAFDPCGHLCACQSCGALLDECPVCRQKATKRLRIDC